MEYGSDHSNSAVLGSTGGPIGHVLSVRGSEAHIGLPAPWPDETMRATVGKFLAIKAGPHDLVGMITEVSARHPSGEMEQQHRAIARVALMGEIVRGADGVQAFRRGVSEYPAIGDAADLVSSEHLRLIYTPAGMRTINVGHLIHDSSIPAHIDVDSLVSKHFAILGSTGVGKSSGVTIILEEILKARPDLRVFLLDGHNEYGRSFGDRANVISPRTLKLPFWLFNFEELTDVIYGGRPAVAEEIEILGELIPIAKSAYLQYKSASDRFGIKKNDPKRTGYTVDTPVPYLLQDLLALIDDRMGKLENRSSRMNYHRLMMRIETIKNDPRYAFMFENASVGGDTMVSLLSHLFRLEPDGKPMTIMQLAGLPVEVVDAVVCVLCRLAFDFGLWSDGAMPLLFVCEEAHRYAAADRSIGFGPTRRALARIAKEGRKYGLFLGLVTQRPAELDPTIISQCSTLFAMRMANDHDQALLRSAVADAALNLLDFVPSLGTGEVVGFGEGMPMPARLTFRTLAQEAIPHSDSAVAAAADSDGRSQHEFIKAVVDRWRGASRDETASAGREPQPEVPTEQPGLAISRLLDDARMQILKR
ncbi:MAG: ATP-binding protein [Devosia nanyangense]|uniref:ATP-binding protein n=1 Tax=Devosia nanyangense TaxID=1228055 RepID=A0A933L288_9HYPH|nr:ATP-binding protein [Devosia nanyangense]